MRVEVEAFLQRIRAYPDDDTPRLIFADWLEEQAVSRGDLAGTEWGGERARFIRVQIALARLTADGGSAAEDGGRLNPLASSTDRDPRRELLTAEQTLLAAYETLWTAPFRGLATGLEFRRGFVEVAKVAARQFLLHSQQLFATGPIRHLHLLDVGGSLSAVFQSHFLARLSGLTIHAQHIGEPLARLVSRCSHLADLRYLRLSRNRLEDDAADHLAASSFLSRLEELDLSENDLGEAAGRALAGSPQLTRVRRLELGGNRLGPAGAEAIAGSDRLTALTRLGLAGNEIGSPRLHTLPRPQNLLAIPHLDLSANGLNAERLRVLLATPPDAPPDRQVRELDLSHNDLGDEGAAVIARSPALTRLRVLRLVGCGIGDQGVAALAAAENLPELRELSLENNPIGDAGFRPLLAANGLRKLRRLGVPRVGISVTMQRLLAARYLRARR